MIVNSKKVITHNRDITLQRNKKTKKNYIIYAQLMADKQWKNIYMYRIVKKKKKLKREHNGNRHDVDQPPKQCDNITTLLEGATQIAQKQRCTGKLMQGSRQGV